MKILVTGVAGFIGFHLVKKLLEDDYEVIGLDNINDYYDVELKYKRLKKLGIKKENIKYGEFIFSKKNKNYKFIKLDLVDRKNIETLFQNEKFDAVCNLAAQAGVRYSIENPHAYIGSNINGFLNILEGCRHNGVTNLSYASSSSVYGLNKTQPFKTTDKTDTPISLYAATKKSNELMAHVYSHLYGLNITGLRFFTVYGPWGRPDMAPMLFADAIFKNKPIKVFNYGKMSRDFTYIDDIVNGIVKVIASPSKYAVYNIGNNSPVNLMDFINEIEKAIGIEAKKQFLDMQPGDVESTYADVSELIIKFNYKPNTLLNEGIRKFIKWYRKYYGY